MLTTWGFGDQRVKDLMNSYLRRFLFQTELGSGAVAGLPFVVRVLVAPPRLEPDFATSFNLEAEDPEVPVGVVDVVFAADASGRDTEPEAALAARKVRLTDTDLKVCGFLTADEVRTWPLSSDDLMPFEVDASVSDPPLTLTSAEFTSSSTISAICLFSISSRDPVPEPVNGVAM
jgi:hypothetical protein